MSCLLFPGIGSHTSGSSSSSSSSSSVPVALPPIHDWLLDDVADATASTLEDGFHCDECETGFWIQIHHDEVICTKCGSHYGFQIDSSAEYRWFGSEDRNPDPTRVGNPLNPLLPESSLGTRILTRPGDSKAMRRIRQYHLWNIMPYRERTLWTIFEMLQVRAANAGISMAIVEETKQLYAQVSTLCICRGQQKDALLAACLYESLKRHDTPRRPVDIAEIFQIDAKLITRGVKQFSGLLEEHLHAARASAAPAVDMAEVKTKTTITSMKTTYEKENEREKEKEKQKQNEKENGNEKEQEADCFRIMAEPTKTKSEEGSRATPSTHFRHYLEPAIYRLETPRLLHNQIVSLAIHLGGLIDELGICPETTPSSLAASALALTCETMGLEKTNAEVAKVCTISVATLQKCLKRIEPWRTILFKAENGSLKK